MAANPVFFDPSRRRSLWSKRAVGALLIALVLAAAAFATTILSVPAAPGFPMPFLHGHALRSHGSHGSPWRMLLPHKMARGHNHNALAIGFYVSDDEASLASLRLHANALDWVVPALASVPTAQPVLNVASDANLMNVLGAIPSPPKLLPMVQNLDADGWNGAGITRIMSDPAASQKLATAIAQMVKNQHGAGVVLDFEELSGGAMPGYARFLHLLRADLPKGSQLVLTAPAGDSNWDLGKLGRIADHVIFMAYDQHWQGGQPGPIAAQNWFVREVERARAAIGPDKLIVALGNYGYDWHDGGADALTVEEAWLAAHDSGANVEFDPASGTPYFGYEDDGSQHQIALLDAATAWNQMQALGQLGLKDVALWRLGSEDSGFWNDLSAFRHGTRPDLSHPSELINSDIEGSGELLRITATPAAGLRSVRFDADGMIRDEQYQRLPTPYVVHRAGANDPKRIALTFDDGPDAIWTPKILRILKAAHVPGTFFVVGENALAHPALLNQIIDQGGELGSHTYTHPNLAKDTPAETRLELNTTQRLVEAYTGRRMTLFRAPYFGDAEPTTADELGPAAAAQAAGYTIVGLHVDPNDWMRPGTDAIVKQVLTQIHQVTPDRSENVILLHDGGGDRAQTVAALPQIIHALKAQGYYFVTASELVGVPPAQAMPRVSGSDLAAVRTDVAIFLVLAGLSITLGWIFYLAISLGIARAVIMAALAWWQSRKRRAEPPQFLPSVSVIIPAYNEERVIAASIARVLASDYPALDVIVADDGSKDRTSACVAEAFGDDPRVRLLTLVNGGKAAALNRALKDAQGEVIIALDADTQFEAETIRRLARWFADPEIGAVAGDARVGNRVNLVTRWQAVEYITAQNLERRALAGFDAMTVVPGAVGAWRRSALDSVGGYPEDTLAEDQDLTIAIQRAGWRVTYDPRATAWTEAPESFRALAKQRYRWAFGTLQCLWKHRAILRKREPAGLALIGMPQAWLFQILFAAISPLIDLALIMSIVGTALRVAQHGWAQTSGDVFTMALYWSAFTAIDLACGWVAYRLDGRGIRYPWLLLLAQRLVYRQIMYWVVLRAIGSAIAGWSVGWGKLERSGRVQTEQTGTGANAAAG